MRHMSSRIICVFLTAAILVLFDGASAAQIVSKKGSDLTAHINNPFRIHTNKLPNDLCARQVVSD